MKNFFKKIASSISDKREKATLETELSLSESDHLNTAQEGVPYFNLCQIARNIKNQEILVSQSQAKPSDEVLSIPAIDPEVRDAATSAEEVQNTATKRYETCEVIGKGGTAIVYRAVDIVMNRDIAFKRFFTDKDGNDYLGEIETIAQISHPNVVVTHDAGEDEEGAFIVMSLIDGMDLQEFLKLEKFDLMRFMRFASQVLEGLLAVHTKRILHLDIKPSNIMIASYGAGRMHAQLIDFGASKLMNEEGYVASSKKSQFQGSVYSMSPEQFKLENLDQRSDIYSMGCVFYETLTREVPFQGDSAITVMASHLQNIYTPMSNEFPEKLAAIISKMISLDPEDRYDSVNDILTDLSEVV